MSATLTTVQALAQIEDVIVSRHAYERLESLDIPVRDVVDGAATAIAVEDYPDHHKGPSVLVLQADGAGGPLHVVWGLRKDTARPAVVVTVYRPDPFRWSEDFRSRT